jgi:hypothetical protein
MRRHFWLSPIKAEDRNPPSIPLLFFSIFDLNLFVLLLLTHALQRNFRVPILPPLLNRDMEQLTAALKRSFFNASKE